MRFKTIVVVFNVVIVLSFLFIFLVPLALLGPGYFSLFLSRNWIAGVLFVVALAAVNGYFGLNWRLFGLLEREDWPGLVRYLEEQVYRKGRVRAKQVRLLANAYLITQASGSTRALEEEVRRKRPELVNRFAVQFGVPYLLAAETEEAERYFTTMAGERAARDRGWLSWNLAFCLCRRGKLEAARKEIVPLSAGTTDPVLRLLALYLLDTACDPDVAGREAAERGRAELRRQYPPAQWKRVVEKARSNLEVVVLSRVIDDAGEWMRREAGSPGSAPAS
jgi:hypothetical protein